jgi:hypothetical protein
MASMRLDKLLEQIIAINHAWKLSREEFGNDFCATRSFRETKSSLQATILREFPNDVYLALATDSEEHGEEMYSVRFRSPIIVNGVLRNDAEHLPKRIAEDIFFSEEINHFLNR